MPAVWRNRRDMTSKLTWILNLWKMSSHNKRNTTWELVVEQVSKFLRHTLPMLVAKSRMEARKVCEDLDLISVRDVTMASGGMGGGWVAGGGGTDVVGASIVWGLVAWGVGRATVSEGASTVVGEERVRRGGEL